ncbi:hypothetical protein C6496_00340 [Candidatus Poribacteria bacterium]|nr:MAG: hypothetical protein C6496_00340 [Candidatus Poribacteria bacterium]
MQDQSKSPNTDRLKIVYDREADVLYVTKGTPEHTDYVEYTEEVILRFHPETKQLVGFTLIDFSKHFAKAVPDIGLPFTVDFQMHNEADLLSYED